MDKPIEIAVIVAGIDEEYQNGVIDGIRHCAKMNNANISCFCAFGGVLANSKFDVGEYNIYSLINYSKFDGVILMTNTISSPVDKEKIIAKVKSTGLPVTILDCDEHPEFYNISIDNYTAMQAIVRHVIEKHNVKRLNYISGPMENPEAAERMRAFRETIAEYSIPYEYERVFVGEFRAADGKNAVDAFLSSGLQRPQAIICANDAMALAAVEELGNFGYKIPDDMIVTGFDNTYNARHHLPALTTVSRPLDDAGFKACEILIGLIIGREYPKNTVLNASPVFSESCGCVSVEETDISEYRVSAYKLLNSCRMDVSLLNRMTTELADTQDSASTIHTVSKIINEIKFDRFCLCLCSNWDQVVSNGLNIDPTDTSSYQIHGYTPKMLAPLVLENNINDPVSMFDSADMYPAPLKRACCVTHSCSLSAILSRISASWYTSRAWSRNWTSSMSLIRSAMSTTETASSETPILCSTAQRRQSRSSLSLLSTWTVLNTSTTATVITRATSHFSALQALYPTAAMAAGYAHDSAAMSSLSLARTPAKRTLWLWKQSLKLS